MYNALINWMIERHAIYKKRAAGRPKPWTADPILQRYKFTNVLRELDAVSQDLIAHLETYGPKRPPEETLFNIVAYRTFNVPEAFHALTGGSDWISRWDTALAERRLNRYQDIGGKVFTGAYIMCATGTTGMRKHTKYLQTLRSVWGDRYRLTECVLRTKSIQAITEQLAQYSNYGPFVAYEFATDLTYTPLLKDAVDILTWANPGPGARRGLNRLHGRNLTAAVPKAQLVSEMRSALAFCRKAKRPAFWGRALELRDIEHSLCEFDKYERVRTGLGRPRSKYPGV